VLKGNLLQNTFALFAPACRQAGNPFANFAVKKDHQTDLLINGFPTNLLIFVSHYPVCLRFSEKK